MVVSLRKIFGLGYKKSYFLSVSMTNFPRYCIALLYYLGFLIDVRSIRAKRASRSWSTTLHRRDVQCLTTTTTMEATTRNETQCDRWLLKYYSMFEDDDARGKNTVSITLQAIHDAIEIIGGRVSRISQVAYEE